MNVLPYSNVVPGMGWNKIEHRKEEKNKIEKEEFAVYDQVY
jgi:imidazoleglycerol phosphate synthase glutamine amidotransferase subunit HisH